MNISTVSRPFPLPFLIACAFLAISALLPIVATAGAPAKANGEADAEKLATQAETLLDSWRGGMSLLTEADKLIVNALALDPKSAHALVEKGRYLIMSSNAGSGRLDASNLDRAEVMFRKAAEADPKYARAYTLQGYIYTLTGQLESAKRALEKADQIGTDDPWLPLNWSAYWTARGDQQRAVAKCERAVGTGTVQAKPLRAAWICIHGYYREAEPNREKADLSFRELIKLEPDSAALRGDYAQFLAIVFLDFDASEKLAREALAMSDYPHARGTLSLSLYGKWARAVVEKRPSTFIEDRLRDAEAVDPDGSRLPSCAFELPQLSFVLTALRNRASQARRPFPNMARC